MPKNSGQQGNRSFGLDHQNGKGDKSRITDIKTYRENYDGIDWGSRSRTEPLKTLREIAEEFDWRHGLCI